MNGNITLDQFRNDSFDVMLPLHTAGIGELGCHMCGEIEFRLAATHAEVEQYLHILEQAIRKEHEWPFRAWPIEQLSDSLVVVAVYDRKIIGGFRIVGHCQKPFLFLDSVRPVDGVPDWRTIRELGRIGQIMALTLNEQFREKLRFSDVMPFFKVLVEYLQLEYVMLVSGVHSKVSMNTTKLYAMLGFYPLCRPLFHPKIPYNMFNTSLIALGYNIDKSKPPLSPYANIGFAKIENFIFSTQYVRWP